MSDEASEELEAIAARDADAFARWLAGGEPRLRASLRSFAAVVDVEAILQETLLRVWQIAPRVSMAYGRSDPLLSVALRIARNLAIDQSRRAGRTAPIEPEPDRPERVLRTPDPWLRAAILRCLDALPRQPRRAIEARITSAGSDDDTALSAALGMRPNTFLKNVGRARSLLASCLARNGVDLGSELR